MCAVNTCSWSYIRISRVDVVVAVVVIVVVSHSVIVGSIVYNVAAVVWNGRWHCC